MSKTKGGEIMVELKPMKFVDEVDSSIYKVSSSGEVIDTTTNTPVQRYLSTNGHCYMLLNMRNGMKRLYLQENIIAITFLKIPTFLIDKSIKIIHNDNNILNNECDNLKLVEFIEEWKQIMINNVITDYFISNIGRVKSIKYGKLRMMKPQNATNNCLKINLRVNNEYTNEFIHRLVASAFIPNTCHCEMVNHIDGNRKNPNYLNLEWVTPSQNTRHAVLTGLHKNFHNGIENPANKYSEDIVHMVCKMLMGGYSIPKIAKSLDVSESLIRRILYENGWKHITSQYDLNNRNRK